MICLIGSPMLVGAQGVDLSNLPAGALRSRMKRIMAALSPDMEVPLPMFAESRGPHLFVASKALTLSTRYNHGLTEQPSFWGAILITPNLTLAGYQAATQMKTDNLTSYGPAVGLRWGDLTTPYIFQLAINHVYGLDDFHWRNIYTGISRYFRWQKWACSLGFVYHTNRCKLHIENHLSNTETFKTSKNIALHYFKGGLYYQFKQATLGMDLSASQDILTGRLMLVLVL